MFETLSFFEMTHQCNPMKDKNNFDVIIIGGSYAGLSAAMALGRSLRKVLIIDSGNPCNRQTPRSHNFITQDGKKPSVIAAKAKEQVLNYRTVEFIDDLATSGKKTEDVFTISTASDKEFDAKKLIFATGIKDILPDIQGFPECWGTSIIHCPYCHGYEVKNEITGILDSGDAAMHYAQLVRNLTKQLTVFTNGQPTFTDEQSNQLTQHDILVVEHEIDQVEHTHGQIDRILFKDGSSASVKALYAKAPFEQHSSIPATLGCALTDQGFIEVNPFQQTSVEGVFACGDNTTFMRSVANAVATGNVAGAMTNKELCEEEFHFKG